LISATLSALTDHDMAVLQLLRERGAHAPFSTFLGIRKS
jgi:hypothetical protein